MSNRRESNQTLHVSLGQTTKGTIDDSDDRKKSDPRCPLFGRGRKNRNCDTHETVRSELQQNCRQDDRTLRWGLRVRIGQPGVEWEHRNFDRKADEHSAEDPDLCRASEQPTVFSKLRNRERWLDTSGQFTTYLVEQRDEGNEHESRTEHRVQEELERCVLTIFAAPHTDHEVHRQQHHFKEHEEQDEVLRNEGSGHTCLQDEHQDEESLGVTR